MHVTSHCGQQYLLGLSASWHGSHIHLAGLDHTSFIPTLKREHLSAAMAPVFSKAVNLQEDSPLFSKIPQELRDKIFDLVVTPHEEKRVPYPKTLRYTRPGFRHADRKLFITIFRCCQLIYSQTCHLPTKNYVYIDWICEGRDGHGFDDYNRLYRSLPKGLQNLHLFTTRGHLYTSI